MKGVILAGGAGSRMLPCTKVTNKHLLPVWNKPMIYYPVNTLISAGIKDILVVSGTEHSGDFLKLLNSGDDFNARFTYRCQEGSGGIPVALNLAKKFVGDDKFIMILGDNITLGNIKKQVAEFEKGDFEAKVFLKEVHDPERYGVAVVKEDKVVEAIEKPKTPPSNLAIIGIYLFTKEVFEVIPKLKPSARGELEIVDILNHFIKKGTMGYEMLEGYWNDAGTFEALYHAATMVKKHEEEFK